MAGCKYCTGVGYIFAEFPVINSSYIKKNTCNPALKLLNEEITSDIQKHKQHIWKEHFNAHWDHRHNTHTL